MSKPRRATGTAIGTGSDHPRAQQNTPQASRHREKVTVSAAASNESHGEILAASAGYLATRRARRASSDLALLAYRFGDDDFGDVQLSEPLDQLADVGADGAFGC